MNHRSCKTKPYKIHLTNGYRYDSYIKGIYCKRHNKECCRCGEEWGYHYEDTEEEHYKPKDNCVVCNCHIQRANYYSNGNYCSTCSGRAQKVSNKTITREEANVLLQQRFVMLKNEI